MRPHLLLLLLTVSLPASATRGEAFTNFLNSLPEPWGILLGVLFAVFFIIGYIMSKMYESDKKTEKKGRQLRILLFVTFIALNLIVIRCT